MANWLKMAQVHTIQVLGERKWSQRRIARELSIHCETVARYLRQAREGRRPDRIGGPAKPAKVITESDGLPETVRAEVITGQDRCAREPVHGPLYLRNTELKKNCCQTLT